ncbi:MAG: sulfite exporter TauE/SafE family protein [Gammaproteobacteria bacterium]|nr:sulfite exporter TauE/SafE family protein [Gammaproteobacteria bacterium]
MTSEDITFLAAFLMGVVSAPHCAGMCGGIVGALAMRTTRSGSGLGSMLVSTLNYNLGRITTYAVLGLVFGAIGMSLHHLIPIAGELLRIVAALLMICMGLYIGGWWMGLRHLENLGFRLWKPVRKFGVMNGTIPASLEGYVAGIFWGCLPCGLVYTLLTFAMTTGDMLKGGLIMISFGLGTFPTLFLAGAFANRLLSLIRRKTIRSAMASIVILFGVWTLTGVIGANFYVHEGDQMHQNELK